MSLFVMADLHLSSNGAKSMEVFGSRWIDYMEKIRKGWNAVVTEEDTVIIPGDVSWGLRAEDAVEDFLFLESLPGKKLIGKGNHDFWWSTRSKLMALWAKHGIESIDLLYNNAHRFDDCIVCGTRGWFLEEEKQLTVGEVDFTKIQNREAQRLKLSLDAARALRSRNVSCSIVFITSYPNFVLESFEVQPYRFLLKPAKTEQIHELMTGFVAQHRLLAPLMIQQDGCQITIESKNILYLEASGKNCIIRTADDTYTSSKTLAQVHALLPQHCFYRTHKSYVVNLYSIRSFDKESVTLINGEVARIGRATQADFRRDSAQFVKDFYVKV